MKWIKASEDKSQHHVKVGCRLIGTDYFFTGAYDWSRQTYRGIDGRDYDPKDVEWLDESPSAEVKKQQGAQPLSPQSAEEQIKNKFAEKGNRLGEIVGLIPDLPSTEAVEDDGKLKDDILSKCYYKTYADDQDAYLPIYAKPFFRNIIHSAMTEYSSLMNGQWQLCPKCHGDGHLGRYNSPNLSTTATPLCDVCHGAKIIAPPSLMNKEKDREIEKLLEENKHFSAEITYLADKYAISDYTKIIQDRNKEISDLKYKLAKIKELKDMASDTKELFPLLQYISKLEL